MNPPAASPNPFARFLAHAGLFQFASCLAGVFLIAFMLKRGVPPAVIFLAVGATFCLRFILRPLVIMLAKAVGLRGAMVAGTGLSCLQYLALIHLDGVDVWLAAWVVGTAIGDVAYWTMFHVMFASVGDPKRLGRQTSLRQIVYTGAGILGPPLGGLLLTWFDPAVAFSAGAALRVASALPLLAIPDPPFLRQAPTGAYRSGSFGALVFITDGWVICSSAIAWGMICFAGLGGRFDTLGAALAAASVAGAAGGFLLGRLVDLGKASRAVRINLAAGTLMLLTQALAGGHPALIVATMIFSAIVGGLSVPAMMPAVYGAVQDAPCALRYQFTTEAGWDLGAASASACCACMVWLGAPLWSAILIAIPALVVQASLLSTNYKSRGAAVSNAN